PPPPRARREWSVLPLSPHGSKASGMKGDRICHTCPLESVAVQAPPALFAAVLTCLVDLVASHRLPLTRAQRGVRVRSRVLPSPGATHALRHHRQGRARDRRR